MQQLVQLVIQVIHGTEAVVLPQLAPDMVKARHQLPDVKPVLLVKKVQVRFMLARLVMQDTRLMHRPVLVPRRVLIQQPANRVIAVRLQTVN